VYVPDDARWPAHFRGMGVRVEDSVCVTEDGPLNLTVEAVKEVRFSSSVADEVGLTVRCRLPTSRL
jgi:hypothetical protein